jgi:O-antigen/teichoic acid export membrane protein
VKIEAQSEDLAGLGNDSRDPQAISGPESGLLSGRIAGTVGTTLAMQCLGLVSGALLARLLGVHDRGLLAALMLWPIVAVHVGDLGGPIANAFLAATRPERIAGLVANSLVLTGLQAVPLGAIAAVLMMLSLRRYGDLLPAGLAFVAIYVPANLGYRYLNFINLGRGRFDLYNSGRLVLQASYVLGVLILFVGGQHSIILALGVYAFCHVVAFVVAAKNLSAYLSLKMRGSWDLVRATVRYGLRAHLGNLAPVDMMQLDLAAVVVLLGPKDAGLYAIAASVGLIIRAYGGALGTVALPHVASAADDKQRRANAGNLFRLSVMMIAPIAISIFVTAGFLVPLIYGSQFVAAVPIVRVLVLGMIAAALRQVLGDCLRGAGRPLTATISEVSGWLIAIIGLAILVPVLGSTGAAVAVSISYGTTLLISLAFARQFGMTLTQLFVPTPSDLRLAVGFARDWFNRPTLPGRRVAS